MKNILVIHYSQSGQLTDILDNLLKPLCSDDQISITSHQLEMENPYPFPWKKKAFFDVFPETFLQIPKTLKPIPNEILNTKYDLIILGYQIWYLTPSIPINSFLSLDGVKKLFNNTNVITVIGCRNMWVQAQEKLKEKLKYLEAKLVGNIVLVDRHPNHVSVITIVQWMFTGKKKKYLGVFPKPGVSQTDIVGASRFGDCIKECLLENKLLELQNKLVALKAVIIKPFLVHIDKKANVMFKKWAKLIYSKGPANSSKRRLWLVFFNYYLLIAIWVISPIVFVLFLLSYIPCYFSIKKAKEYYLSTELK